MNRGVFVTFEGGEGAGKSTQVRQLATFLEARKLEVCQTREPGGSAGAEIIRTLLVEGKIDRWDPLTETLLHYAARCTHLERKIRPAQARGAWVLCDRFADSTEAYQGYGQGVNIEVIRAMRAAVVGASEPDLTVILDVPVEIGLARARSRDAVTGRYESMDAAIHERIRAAFLEIARNSGGRCVVFDATRPADVLQAEIQDCVADRFDLKPGDA